MRCDYPNDPTSSIPHPINRQHLLASSSPATITTLSPSSSSRSGSPCNSSSSSGALSSPQVSAQPSRDRSMEDVWREIALCPTPSLDNPRCNNYMHQQPQPTPHHPVTAPLMTLEDFLRGAPSATGALAAPPMTVQPLGQIHNKAVPPSIGVIVPRPPPPAPVAVPLSPSFDFGFAVDVANADTHQPTTKPRDHQNLQQKNGRPPASPFAIGSPATPFSGTNIGSSPLSAFLPLGSQRRIPEQPLLPPAQTQPAGAVAGSGYVIEGGERRRKRMIKNRESAARSRARKQDRSSRRTPTSWRSRFHGCCRRTPICRGNRTSCAWLWQHSLRARRRSRGHRRLHFDPKRTEGIPVSSSVPPYCTPSCLHFPFQFCK